MLRVNASRNSAAAKAYYSKAGDYYAYGRGGDYVGEWQGRFAEQLGLSGPATMEDFHALCDNRHPRTGERLTGSDRENRRALIDFTWSVPKSVALMRALLDDDRIEKAIWETVTDTMQDIEKDIAVRVRKNRAFDNRVVGNGIWLPFYHRTSRPVDGEPDMGDHIHACLLNMAYDPVERQAKAVEIGHIKARAPYWQAAWHARLAKRLRELGYDTTRTKDAFEIAGVSNDLIKRFSRRTSLIERITEELGITDPTKKDKVGAITREKKTDELTPDELFERWLARLKPGELEELQGIYAESKLRQGREVETHNAAAIDWALSHHHYRESVIEEDKLLVTALKHGVGEVTAEGLERELTRPEIIRATMDGRRLVTTRAVLAEERKVLEFAQKGRGSFRPMNASGAIEDKELSAEQTRAVAHVWNSRNAITLIRGRAGTGKTRMMREAVRGIKSAGHDVVVLAPSSEASRGVLAEEGFADATTVADFLDKGAIQERARGNVIWIDEAGMLGFQDMARVIAVAEHLKARIVLSGDRRQHRSVLRGEPLAVLEDQAGLPVAELHEIRRQERAEYKAAVQLLASGQVSNGFKALDAMGAVKLMPVWDKYEPLVDDYLDAVVHRKSVLVLSPTHKEGAAITSALRTRLKEEGRLSDERTVMRLAPLNLTEAERSDVSNYESGLIVQFFKRSGPYRAGQRVKVTAENAEDLAKRASVTQLYSESTLALAVGDRVRITANGKSGIHRVCNGSVYDINGFTARGEPVLNNGWVLSKEFGHWSHGYVLTSFGGQGKTVERVLIAQSATSFPASNQRQMYVDASRGRESVTIYTDDRWALRQAITRDDRRLHAIDLMKHKEKKPWFVRLRNHLERLQSAASFQPPIAKPARQTSGVAAGQGF